MMKFLTVVALLCSQASSAEICTEGSVCEGREETSLMQVKQTLQRRSNESSFPLDSVMKGIEHCFKRRGEITSSGLQCCKQQGFAVNAFHKCPEGYKKVDDEQCGGYAKFTAKKKLKVYMHSGTAVNYYKCRKELNDVDLWIPKMPYFLPKNVKKPLADAYKGKHAKWEKGAGLTDKGVKEHSDQVYCPEEKVGSTSYKEVDAFVGTCSHTDKRKCDPKFLEEEKKKPYRVNYMDIYPKFDMKKFSGIASGGVKSGKLVDGGNGDKFDLYVIGECKLIELKVALINGGRGDATKATDVDDLCCLCEKYGKPTKDVKDGEVCSDRCEMFEKLKKDKKLECKK